MTKSPIPPMHPREKLTQKAIRAIVCYVNIKLFHNEWASRTEVIHYTLEAERMTREQLYTYLTNQGWGWKPALDTWKKKER